MGPDIYLLLSDFLNQFDVPCFDCHTETGQLQDPQAPMNQQYNYSRIAGGDTTITCPDNIARAFAFLTSNCGSTRSNCGSSTGSVHCLATISNFLINKWGFYSAAANNDPCSGCHNPHRAKRDPHTTIGRTDGSGNLMVSPVSRPSRHSKDNNVWDLWGDQSGETMRDYALTNGVPYQAPYRYNSTTTYEPDGSNITNGSNLFDTVTFCLDCHSQSAGGRKIINWGINGDIHGKASSHNCCDLGDKKAPYPADPASPTPYPNHVLSCLDCHEPHGSQNEQLLRQEVNGTNVAIITQTNNWWNFCSGCHTMKIDMVYHAGLNQNSTCVCHGHGQCWPGCGLPGCATDSGCTASNKHAF